MVCSPCCLLRFNHEDLSMCQNYYWQAMILLISHQTRQELNVFVGKGSIEKSRLMSKSVRQVSSVSNDSGRTVFWQRISFFAMVIAGWHHCHARMMAFVFVVLHLQVISDNDGDWNILWALHASLSLMLRIVHKNQTQEKICHWISLNVVILELSMKQFFKIVNRQIKSCIVAANCKYVVRIVHTISEHPINKDLQTSNTHYLQWDMLDVDLCRSRQRQLAFVTGLPVKTKVEGLEWLALHSGCICKRGVSRRLICFV